MNLRTRPRRSGPHPRLAALLIALPLLGGCDDGPTDPSSEPDDEGFSFTVVGEGLVSDRFTSDLWVHGNHVYTGTWGFFGERGNTVFVWDVTDPAAPTLVDSVQVDAGTTNDVKVSADGSLAVLTHEGSEDGLNGITLLDLSDPAHPIVLTRYTTDLEDGVHNVWIEDDFLYVVARGTTGLVILDVSDPAAPVEVARFYGGSSIVHDVLVRDGLAFVSHWGAGLIVLDVGNGIRGGSAVSPVEVSRIDMGINTHNAWYWPDGGYVFVGDEDFLDVAGNPGRAVGKLHVVDVADLANPVEVATFRTEKNRDPPHNFWMDEAREILYMAWYSEGMIALDVSGDLSGILGADRILGIAHPNGFGDGCRAPGRVGDCMWAPQLHDGRIFVSDMHRGLLVFEPEF